MPTQSRRINGDIRIDFTLSLDGVLLLSAEISPTYEIQRRATAFIVASGPIPVSVNDGIFTAVVTGVTDDDDDLIVVTRATYIGCPVCEISSIFQLALVFESLKIEILDGVLGIEILDTEDKIISLTNVISLVDIASEQQVIDIEDTIQVVEACE